MDDKRLIYVRVPSRLVEELDNAAGQRCRSALVTEALEDYLRRTRLIAAMELGKGTVTPDEEQTWGSDEAVDSLVRERRAEFDRDDR